MNLAPIILFVYNRPLHTQQTLEALALNELAKESVLYIFSDGAKDNASNEILKNIEDTRKLIKSKPWCKDVIIIERPQNFGLAKSVIEGVTQIINQFGKAIVLEDDLVTSPYFLKFMNEALHKYEHQDSVACISAYVYPIPNLPDLFFTKGADCWGWATWKRAWDLFEPDGSKLLQALETKKLTAEFDLNKSYPYTKMLRDQVEGINHSWAIRWYASSFLKNRLCLYPGQSFVNNIGTDGSGTHDGLTTVYETKPMSYYHGLKDTPIEVNTTALNQMTQYFTALDLIGREPSPIKEFIKKLSPVFMLKIYRKIKG